MKKKRKKYATIIGSPDWALTQSFRLSKMYFREAGDVLDIEEARNLHLKVTKQLEKKLKVKRPLIEKIEQIKRRRKIKNGLI